jgi:hypothetical protein
MTTENLINNIEERYGIEIDEVDEAVGLLLRSK